MDKAIGIIFTIIYLAEGTLMFFLNNKSSQDIRFIVMAVVAIILIWVADYFILKSGLSHKSLVLLAIGIVIVVLMPFAWGVAS